MPQGKTGITFHRRQQIIHLMGDHMTDRTDIGQMLQAGKLEFQGFILILLNFHTSVQ